jgi:hypothetical protein
MTCAIFVMDDDGNPQLAGTFKLRGGKISAQITSGSEILMNELLSTPNWLNAETSVTAASNPKKWFKALPANNCGTYVRAQFMPGKKKH